MEKKSLFEKKFSVDTDFADGRIVVITALDVAEKVRELRDNIKEYQENAERDGLNNSFNEGVYDAMEMVNIWIDENFGERDYQEECRC